MGENLSNSSLLEELGRETLCPPISSSWDKKSCLGSLITSSALKKLVGLKLA